VVLDYPEHGGHVGFAVGRLPGSINWLPQRLIHFLEGKRANNAPYDGQLCQAVGI
jgi:predicted alpha/beta-fold hydrolase